MVCINKDVLLCLAERLTPNMTKICNVHHLTWQFDFESRIQGANFLAYPPVVAGGNRANTLHYINNNQVIKVKM